MRREIARDCFSVHRFGGFGVMKCLIVNGDDFGASRGINLGILEAYRSGILTSASLMVNTPWSEEAVALSRNVPDMSVGLHIDLTPEEMRSPINGMLELALRRQLSKFRRLMGR